MRGVPRTLLKPLYLATGMQAQQRKYMPRVLSGVSHQACGGILIREILVSALLLFDTHFREFLYHSFFYLRNSMSAS